MPAGGLGPSSGALYKHLTFDDCVRIVSVPREPKSVTPESNGRSDPGPQEEARCRWKLKPLDGAPPW